MTGPPLSLPARSVRLLTPRFLLVKLKQHPLTRGLFPLAMGRYPAAVDHEITADQDDSYLLIYCHEGKGWCEIDGRLQKVKTGDLLLLAPGQQRHYGADEQAPWSVYWVAFDGEQAPDFAERLMMKMTHGLGAVGHQPQVMTDFKGLLTAWGEPGYTATNVIYGVHLLQQMLSFLALQLRLRESADSTEIDLKSLEAFMLERLHTNLTLDMLARQANLSRYHFSRKFRALTDNSPIQHFINLRMQHACHLLDNSGLPIHQVAMAVGYEDPYYFSRLFKKVVGITPSRYRGNRREATPP